MLVIDSFHIKILYTYTQFLVHMFLKVVLVSCYQIVRMKKLCICCHMFFKSSVGYSRKPNCLNAKNYIWNGRYTLQHRIERSQTTNCIQYDIHDTMSYELPNFKSC